MQMEVSPLSRLTPISSPLFIYLLYYHYHIPFIIIYIYIHHYIWLCWYVLYLPYQVSISSRQHVTRWPSSAYVRCIASPWRIRPCSACPLIGESRPSWYPVLSGMVTIQKRMDHFKRPQTHTYRECLYKKIVFWLREICSAMPMSALLTCWKKQKTSFGR